MFGHTWISMIILKKKLSYHQCIHFFHNFDSYNNMTINICSAVASPNMISFRMSRFDVCMTQCFVYYSGRGGSFLGQDKTYLQFYTY